MAGQIEFLDPGDDEPQAGPDTGRTAADRTTTDDGLPRARRGSRRGVLVFALVAALIIGLLVTRSVTSGGRHTAAPPTPTRSAVSGVAVQPGALSVILDVTSGQVLVAYCAGADALAGASPNGAASPLPQGGTYNESGADSACRADAAACPQTTDGRAGCSSVDRAPATVVRAVTARFPDARLALAQTETLRDGGRLWYRQLLFALPDRSTLRIDVIQRGKTVPSSGERQDAAGLFGRITHVSGSLVVLVSVAQVSSGEPDYGSLKALAADPRVTALR